MINTLDIRDKIEPINYKHLTVIPRSHIPDFENDHIQMMKNLKELVDENKYENIYKMARSERIEDRYYNLMKKI